jgi:alkylation response protein AidB-like acyl-CoA dehydrogenase
MDMNEGLEEEKIIRESVQKFVNQELKPLADEMEENKHFSRELLKRTGEAGFLKNMGEAEGHIFIMPLSMKKWPK